MRPPIHRPQIVRDCLGFYVNKHNIVFLLIGWFLSELIVIYLFDLQALLLPLNKLKVSEEQKKFAIDSYEPNLAFALSCGMYSSPAVFLSFISCFVLVLYIDRLNIYSSLISNYNILYQKYSLIHVHFLFTWRCRWCLLPKIDQKQPLCYH